MRDWATASQASAWCIEGGQSGIDGSAGSGNADVYILPGCDGYNVVWLNRYDSTSVYLYDIESGRLKGIVAVGLDACVGDIPPTLPVSFGCADASVRPVCGPSR